MMIIIWAPGVSHKKFRARIRPLRLVGTLQLWLFKHDAISDADLQLQYWKLDGSIVWNVHNAVFGSKSAQLHHCLSLFRHFAILTFAVLICDRFDHTPSSSHAHFSTVNVMTWRGVSLVNGRRTSQKIWYRFLVRSVHSRGMTLNWFQR